MTTEEAKLSRIEEYCEAILKHLYIKQKKNYSITLNYCRGSEDTAEQILKIIKEEEK